MDRPLDARRNKTIKELVLKGERMKKGDFVEFLKTDLELCFFAVRQYSDYADRLGEMKGTQLDQLLKVVASQERDNAFIIAEFIRRLGGNPGDYTGRGVTYGNLVELLFHSFLGEQEAIERYSQRKRQAEGLGELELAGALGNIIRTEEEHVHIFKEALAQRLVITSGPPMEGAGYSECIAL